MTINFTFHSQKRVKMEVFESMEYTFHLKPLIATTITQIKYNVYV